MKYCGLDTGVVKSSLYIDTTSLCGPTTKESGIAGFQVRLNVDTYKNKKIKLYFLINIFASIPPDARQLHIIILIPALHA